jgi:glutamate synthase domain-containing protein 3
MAGFMGQKGTMIVCGDAGEAFGDSMYETVCYVGGNIADLGTDAEEALASDEDARFIDGCWHGI